jgi:hypothetical protein
VHDVNDLVDGFDTVEDGMEWTTSSASMDEIHVGFNTYGDVEGRLEHRIHEYEQTRDYYGEQAAGSLVEWLEVQGF